MACLSLFRAVLVGGPRHVRARPSPHISRRARNTTLSLLYSSCGTGLDSSMRQQCVVPTVGAVRIPRDTGVSHREDTLRRIPRHPAIAQAVDHEQPGLVAARHARKIVPQIILGLGGESRRIRYRAARCCPEYCVAASRARSCRTGDRLGAVRAAAHRRRWHRGFSRSLRHRLSRGPAHHAACRASETDRARRDSPPVLRRLQRSPVSARAAGRRAAGPPRQVSWLSIQQSRRARPCRYDRKAGRRCHS